MFALPTNLYMPEYQSYSYPVDLQYLTTAYNNYQQNLLLSEYLSAQLALSQLYPQSLYTNNINDYSLPSVNLLSSADALSKLDLYEQLCKKLKNESSVKIIGQLPQVEEDPDISVVRLSAKERANKLNERQRPISHKASPKISNKEIISGKGAESSINVKKITRQSKTETNSPKIYDLDIKIEKRSPLNKDLGNTLKIHKTVNDEVFIPFLNPEFTDTVENVLSPMHSPVLRNLKMSVFDKVFNEETRSKIECMSRISKSLKEEASSPTSIKSQTLSLNSDRKMEVEKDTSCPIRKLTSKVFMNEDRSEEHPAKFNLITKDLHNTVFNDQIEVETAPEEDETTHHNDIVLTPVGANHQVDPQNIKKADKEGKRRNVKLFWHPERAEHEKLNDYMALISKILDEKVDDQAKIVKLLNKFNNNFDEILKEVEKAKPYYQNFFRICSRKLRAKGNSNDGRK